MDRGVEGAKCQKGYVIDFGSELHCDVDTVDFHKFKGGSSGPSPQLFNTDHVYPHEKDSAPVAILYGEAGKLGGFKEAHELLKKLAGKGIVKYVLRPYLVDRPEEKARMSGYGVELQIKKTEYKAQDDAKLDAGSQVINFFWSKFFVNLFSCRIISQSGPFSSGFLPATTQV